MKTCCGYLLEATQQGTSNEYGKCPKILYTQVSDKTTYMYANSADPDQTVCHLTRYFKKQLHKSNI